MARRSTRPRRRSRCAASSAASSRPYESQGTPTVITRAIARVYAFAAVTTVAARGHGEPRKHHAERRPRRRNGFSENSQEPAVESFSGHRRMTCLNNPHPRRRRRGKHHRSGVAGAALRAVRGRRRPRRARGARRRHVVSAPSPRARHHAARPRRLRGRAPAGQPGLAHADPLPDRARRDARQDPRPHAGRRRLRDQALQHRGAGGPHPRHPAPRRRRRRRRRPPRVRRSRDGRRHPRGLARPDA